MAAGQKTKPESALDWALFYASQGLAVVPITPGKKFPPLQKWQDKATTDESTIRSWWSKWPAAGVGMVTGAPSGGVVVIDCDYHPERGINGPELVEGEAFPQTWTARTGSGGRHLFFKADGNPQRAQHIYNNQIDFQADRALIILPPTVHPNGNRYTWETPPTDCALAPFSGPPQDFINDGYLAKLGDGFQTPDEVPEGSRTENLFKLLCSLQAKGLPDDEIKTRIREANREKCLPPMSERELQETIFPALKKYKKGKHDKPMSSTATATTPMNGTSTATTPKGPTPAAVVPLTLRTMDAVTEREAEWLIPDHIPKNQISIIAGDGGSGKTSLWCNIAAAISSGKASIFEEISLREPAKVLFFSAEDSITYTLARRLRKNEARLENILSLDISDKAFSSVKFNNEALERVLDEVRPALCIFDPIQSFVPADIKMGDRNAMRQCLEPLIGYGEKYGTTFLIVVHANKQSGVFGRKRIADSADIWDIARSVFLVGETGDGDQRYISHEKCNYGPTQESVLFSLDDEKATRQGTDPKKDREFVLFAQVLARTQPQREDAKQLILDELEKLGPGGKLYFDDLEETFKSLNFTKKTVQRARTELKGAGKILCGVEGYGKDKRAWSSLP